MRLISIFLSLFIFLVIGCARPTSNTNTEFKEKPNKTPTSSSTKEQRTPPSGDYAIIDWIDFIKFNGITYVVSMNNPSINLSPNILGNKYSEIKYTLEGNVHNEKYTSIDGDAAYIPAGTPVYAVKGYNPLSRLAVKTRGKILLYEADTNPKAKYGEDLLDIKGKVKYIGINSEYDGTTELGKIQDKKTMEHLVDLVLAAPVNQKYNEHKDKRYFIAFHLKDSTIINRCYWLDTGELARGILLPLEFKQTILKAVK